LEEDIVKLKTILTLAALGAMGANASATNVTAWGALGPIPSVAIVNYTGPLPTGIDDVYTFTIGATSDVDGYGEEFEARSVSMTNARFTLFSGTWGNSTATQVGGVFTFTNTYTETVYTNLASGSYYFRVQGDPQLLSASYDFEAYANNSVPPSNVPEPGSAALLLAGVSLMGFLGMRRQQRK
jgi:hypothetical protein